MEEGFHSLETFECLQRELQVKNVILPEAEQHGNFSFSSAINKV